MYNLHSQLYLLTALIEYLTVLLEYLDPLQSRWQSTAFGMAWALAGLLSATSLFETNVSDVSAILFIDYSCFMLESHINGSYINLIITEFGALFYIGYNLF